MFELTVALSYLLPRRGRLSQSVVALFAVFVISTIVWLTLVYFSTVGNIQERWAAKIQSIVGTYELIPTDAYFRTPSSLIDAKTARFNYCVPRLSLHSNDTLPSWEEGQDDPLSTRETEALQRQIPLSRLKDILKPFTWQIFEQQVAHATFHAQADNLSQYVILRGIASIDPTATNFLAIQDLTKEEQLSLAQIFKQINQDPAKPALAVQSLELLPVKELGYPLLLPLWARKQGVQLLDKVTLEPSSEQSSSITSIKGYVAGFFDPGVLPIGSKLILCSSEIVDLLSPALTIQEPTSLSGISLQTKVEKDELLKKLKIAQLDDLFTLRSYNETPMTQELFNQLNNEQTLFQLLSSVILFTASANILSMLFIIARDRKKEIALFRALGMKRRRIFTLFSFAGMLTGCFAFLIGLIAAQLTLHFLPECLALISWIQGRNVLDPTIFGSLVRESVRLNTALFSSFFVLASATLAGMGASLYATRISISEALKEP